MTRTAFDHVAREYDAARPDYPAPLYDVLESAIGQPLLRADVLDVGAGTGIATRALAGRGANVVAVDAGPGVLAVLRSRSTSRVRAVVGDGNALPLRSGLFDLVTYAQSWHWVDAVRAMPECARVLRNRGVLATWWNLAQAQGEEWYDAYSDAAERLAPSLERNLGEGDWGSDLTASGLFAWVRKVEIPWTRTLSADELLADYSTHSFIAALAPDVQREVLGVMRARLDEEFPRGVVSVSYVTRVWVARR